MPDPQMTAKQLAREWREGCEDLLAVASLLSRDGVSDTLVEETMRLIIAWREKHRRVTDITDLEISLMQHALAGRSWPDSEASRMGLCPSPPLLTPQPTMVPQYDYHADRMGMVPVKADEPDINLVRSPAHLAYLARTKGEREREALRRAIENDEGPSPYDPPRVPYAGPGKVLARDVEEATAIWLRVMESRHALFTIEAAPDGSPFGCCVISPGEVEVLLRRLSCLTGEHGPPAEQLARWAEDRRRERIEERKAAAIIRYRATKKQTFRALQGEVRRRLGDVCARASAACTSGRLYLHRKAGGGTAVRRRGRQEKEWRAAFHLGTRIAAHYELLCHAHHVEADRPRLIAGGRKGGLRSGAARRRRTA